MAKKSQKAQKGTGTRVQNHLHARIAYLYKATNYLQTATDTMREEVASDTSPLPERDALKGSHTGVSNEKGPFSFIARQYGSQLRAVSLKSQLRLDRDVKRSICKRCDSFLRPGLTCSETMENKSRGRKKPWADTRVVTCGFCKTQKRYPQGINKSIKLAARQKPQPPKEDEHHNQR
ncbi:uncharacterized protein GIQ15_00238 [Arthroderma uncinatum]|uniref:uncharacterized protein n=1 Tax=Arthroderma uncinatum TaxID=74035 RepID=UPI00144AF66A|nr:uncharacterized protein GIQ15_00238 [Arthroderma uncinatum]KAF3490721.1 hypothetical protein GIQ15_00238 [Arthroderma uncinatum]